MIGSVLVVLGTLLSVIEATTFSSLQTQVTVTLREDANFTATVSDINSVTVSWVVGGKYVANLTVDNGGLMLSGGKTMDDSTYDVTTSGNGTTLTLKSPGLTLNGTQVKLTDGTTASNTAVLIVNACGEVPEGGTATCFNINCTATSERNSTLESTKYMTCITAYTCGSSGDWAQNGEPSCSKPICSETGKTGENCTEDCGAGCQTKTCYVNGSCVVAGCMEGYSGDKCDVEITTTASAITSGSETTTSSPSSPSSTSSAATSPAATSSTSSVTASPTSETTTSTMSPTTTTPPTKCNVTGTWGPNCTNACGEGCRVWNRSTKGEYTSTIHCKPETGRCIDAAGKLLQCADGYRGENCDEPICYQDCNNVGICLAPNFCGNCPMHYEHGPTCRNIRLDGFLKGSLPALAVLALVVIVLTVISKWYIRYKIKEA